MRKISYTKNLNNDDDEIKNQSDNEHFDDNKKISIEIGKDKLIIDL